MRKDLVNIVKNILDPLQEEKKFVLNVTKKQQVKMPVITNQTENPNWLNEDKGFDIKKILYSILAIIKGAGSGLLFSAWLLV